jgi:hypothetical protein
MTSMSTPPPSSRFDRDRREPQQGTLMHSAPVVITLKGLYNKTFFMPQSHRLWLLADREKIVDKTTCLFLSRRALL